MAVVDAAVPKSTLVAAAAVMVQALVTSVTLKVVVSAARAGLDSRRPGRPRQAENEARIAWTTSLTRRSVEQGEGGTIGTASATVTSLGGVSVCNL